MARVVARADVALASNLIETGGNSREAAVMARAVDRSVTPVWFWINAFCYAVAAIVALGAGMVFLRAAMSSG